MWIGVTSKEVDQAHSSAGQSVQHLKNDNEGAYTLSDGWFSGLVPDRGVCYPGNEQVAFAFSDLLTSPSSLLLLLDD